MKISQADFFKYIVSCFPVTSRCLPLHASLDFTYNVPYTSLKLFEMFRSFRS